LQSYEYAILSPPPFPPPDAQIVSVPPYTISLYIVCCVVRDGGSSLRTPWRFLLFGMLEKAVPAFPSQDPPFHQHPLQTSIEITQQTDPPSFSPPRSPRMGAPHSLFGTISFARYTTTAPFFPFSLYILKVQLEHPKLLFWRPEEPERSPPQFRVVLVPFFFQSGDIPRAFPSQTRSI